MSLEHPIGDRILALLLIALLGAVAVPKVGPIFHNAAATVAEMDNDLAAAEQQLLAAASGARESNSYDSLTAALDRLAMLYRDQHRYGEAESVLLELLTLRETRLGRAHPAVAAVLEQLGMTAQHQGSYSSAEGWYRRSLTLREEAFGPLHSATASSFLRLGSLYRLSGDVQRADLYLERARSILDGEKPSGATRMLATWLMGPSASEAEMRLMRAGTLYELSAVRGAQGRVSQAKALALEAQRGLAEGTPPPAFEAALFSHLGALAQAEGDSRGALAYYAQGQAIIKRHGLAGSRVDIGLLNNSAVAEAALGRQGSARDRLGRARRIASDRFEEDAALSRSLAFSTAILERPRATGRP